MPEITVGEVQTLIGTTYPPAKNLVAKLVDLGILEEMTSYTRNRRFRYSPYVELFSGEPAATAP